MAISHPFSQKDFIPQEECLLVEPNKSKMFIGVPKENTAIEKRICITPDAVHTLVAHGHKVLLEKGAGESSSYSDLEYSKAGAEITSDTKKVFSCHIVVKVVPPTLEEIAMMAPYSVLWSTIQIKTLSRAYFLELNKKRISCIALDFINDKYDTYPAIAVLSELAGASSILVAAELMATSNQGKGLLFGNITGVVPTEVVIIGSGIIAESAARTALGMGANVRVFDNCIENLRRLQNNLPIRISTSIIQEKLLKKALMRCDVAIGAIRGQNRAPIIVTEAMVENMKQGAVIVDVAIDSGGCFETSELTTHDDPIRIKSGVIHYGVPNITSRYCRSASMAISNVLTPLLIEYADIGDLQGVLFYNSIAKSGLYTYKGLITNRAIADWYDFEYRDIDLFSL